MGYKETDSPSQQEASASSSKDTSFLHAWRRNSKKPDLEQGTADHDPGRANLGKNVEIKPSPYEQRRAEAKQRWRDKVSPPREGAPNQNDWEGLGISSSVNLPQDIEKIPDHSDHSDQAIKIKKETKEIVDWLRKEVLSIPSDAIANKVEKKVKYALEREPAKAKLLRDAIQLQREYDGYSRPLKWWFDSTLSRIKQEVAIKLKQERARYDRLSREVEENGGNKSIKGEMNILAPRIEQYNVFKDKVADIYASVYDRAKEYQCSLEQNDNLYPALKQLKLRGQLNKLDAEATQQINGLKQEYRDNVLREEVTREQGHTTFGVMVGNFFHSAETVLAVGSVFVSGLALKYAIAANSEAISQHH